MGAFSENFYDGIASSLNLIYANGVETPIDFALLSRGLSHTSTVADLQVVQANGFRYWMVSYGFWDLKRACKKIQTHRINLGNINPDNLNHKNWKPLVKKLMKDFDTLTVLCDYVGL